MHAALSHRLLTELDGSGAKRAHNTIYLPRARSGELLSIADPQLDSDLLRTLEEITARHGFELRAVAHEIDRFLDVLPPIVTEIRATVRNTLRDAPLTVHGFFDRPGAPQVVTIPPGEAIFSARAKPR